MNTNGHAVPSKTEQVKRRLGRTGADYGSAAGITTILAWVLTFWQIDMPAAVVAATTVVIGAGLRELKEMTRPSERRGT